MLRDDMSPCVGHWGYQIFLLMLQSLETGRAGAEVPAGASQE